MPIINPEEAIRNSFKLLFRKKRRCSRRRPALIPDVEEPLSIVNEEPVLQLQESGEVQLQPSDESKLQYAEENILRNVASRSITSSLHELASRDAEIVAELQDSFQVGAVNVGNVHQEPLYKKTKGSDNADKAEEISNASAVSDVLTFNDEGEDVGCWRKKYHVAHDLADGNEYVQSRFMQKVFTMIFIKTFILLAFLSVVEMLDDFKNFHIEIFSYHYFSIVLYLLIKITIRLTKNFRRRNCCLHLILHVMDIIALGDFLGCAMTHWLTSYVYFVVPRKILYSIGGTSLFFIFVGWFVEYDMRDGIMLSSALIINGLTSLHQVLHCTLRGYGFDPNMGKLTDEWSCVLIVLGVSEVIILIIMFELKNVLSGNRFSVWYSDWFLTGLYII